MSQISLNDLADFSINGKAVKKLNVRGKRAFPPISFSTLKLDLGSNYHIVAVYDGDGINPGKVASYVVNSSIKTTLYVHNLETGEVITSKEVSTSKGLGYVKAYYMEDAFWFVVVYRYTRWSSTLSYMSVFCPEEDFTASNLIDFGTTDTSLFSVGAYKQSGSCYIYGTDIAYSGSSTNGRLLEYKLFNVTTRTAASLDSLGLKTVSAFTDYCDGSVRPIRVMALGKYVYLTAKNKNNANQVYIFSVYYQTNGTYSSMTREHLGSTSTYPGTDPGYTDGFGSYWSFYMNTSDSAHTYGIVKYDDLSICSGYRPTPPYGVKSKLTRGEGILIENGVDTTAGSASSVTLMLNAKIYLFDFVGHCFLRQIGDGPLVKLGNASPDISYDQLDEGQLKLSYNMGYLADSATGKIYYFPIDD